MDEPGSARPSERRTSSRDDRPLIGGVPVRADDVERTRGLHSIAVLFRVLAGLLGIIVLLQLLNGATSVPEVSYGALIAETIRLVVFAGLLWAAGDLADLFVTSHHDVRAIRITLARLLRRIETTAPRIDQDGRERGRRDTTH